MDTIEVEGLRIAYERAGAGPALVLVHGYVGDGPTTWRPQLDDLAEAFTVVAWDAPGAGGSSDPPEGFGMAGYADCLASFISALGLDSPTVAGLSFGGALALELAHRHPDIPRALILLSAYAGWGGSLPHDEARRRLDQALTLADLSPGDFVEALLPTMFSPGTAPALVAGLAESMARFHPVGFRAMARAAAEDLRPVLRHIAVPTLLVYGDDDVRAPLTVAEQLHTAIASSTLVVLPDTGHVSTLEAPEAVNAAIRAFLGERSGQG